MGHRDGHEQRCQGRGRHERSDAEGHPGDDPDDDRDGDEFGARVGPIGGTLDPLHP